MTAPLNVYLRDHEAAACAGSDLFARAARSQRRRPYGPTLARLHTDVVEDLRALRQLMKDLGVAPDLLLGQAARVAERLSRLKLNGGLLRRTPLADLIEVEGMVDAVHAKLAGWRALAAAGVGAPDDLTRLIERAEHQTDQLWELHAMAAASLRP